MNLTLDEDEAAVLLDALVAWREQANRMYEPEDKARYIAAANRVLDKLDPTPSRFAADGHNRTHADY